MGALAQNITTPLLMAALSLIMSAFTGHAQTVQKQLTPSALGTPPIPITSLPLTIKTPGYYYLVSNMYYSATSQSNRVAITVNSPGVTIDLRGYSLSGPAQAVITVPQYLNLNPVGILLQSSNTTVKNGAIVGFYNQLNYPLFTGSTTYVANIIITMLILLLAGIRQLSLKM
jgi:hypothetical protein